MVITEKTTVGEIVAFNFKTAALFQKLNIDFCCKGNRFLKEVCVDNNLDESTVTNALSKIMSEEDSNADFKNWEVDTLIDYIEKTHHKYVEDKSQVLIELLNKLCKVHGSKHPELFEINNLFHESAEELAVHMKKEELILFPFINKMINHKRNNQNLEKPHFGTVDNPIAMMMNEHENEGDRFRKIALLTNNYTPPADACTTYKIVYKMLEDFENDLHKHIHLENNILFLEAKKLEQIFN